MKELAERLRLLYICGGGEEEIARLAALIRSGVTTVQLRMKNATGRELYERALAVKKTCREKDALFFVNDRLDVALACGASGVHLGQEDLPVTVARRLTPRGFLVGATARTPEQAIRAWRDGADYLGVGAVFPTPTKEDTRVIGPEGFASVAASVPLPCVAVGGITAAAVPDLRRRGAAGVVVVREAVGAPDPAEACRRLRELLDA